jgi:hypothetical protein
VGKKKNGNRTVPKPKTNHYKIYEYHKLYDDIKTSYVRLKQKVDKAEEEYDKYGTLKTQFYILYSNNVLRLYDEFLLYSRNNVGYITRFYDSLSELKHIKERYRHLVLKQSNLLKNQSRSYLNFDNYIEVKRQSLFIIIFLKEVFNNIHYL